MNWREIQILYVRELRAALRERTIVLNSILIPILLYPVMLWAMFTVMSFVRGQQEQFVSRIALVDEVGIQDELRGHMEDAERLEWVTVESVEQADAQIREGKLDAYAEILPPETGAEDGNYRLRVVYSSSKDRSDKAHQRLKDALDSHRVEWLDQRAEALGIAKTDWRQFTIQRDNRASSEEMGSFILGLLVPLFMIIMIAVGCFYPAVDTTAGERERSTWETLMTTGASRSSVITAKYLYVATFGVAAGLLNLFAMALTMRGIMAPLMRGESDAVDFSIPWAALPILGLSAILLACFLAAGMMLFAAFARTFKEGQSMVGPFYIVSILPVLVTQAPDLTLTPKMALFPVANVALLSREAIAGTFNWPMIGLTLLVEVVLVVLSLWAARQILRFEDVLMGSYSGSLGKFIGERFLKRGAKQSEEKP